MRISYRKIISATNHILSNLSSQSFVTNSSNIKMADGVGVKNLKDEVDMLKELVLQENRYLIVDIGANLSSKKFARDLDLVIQRAKDSGVQKIMVTGSSIQSSKDALRLTRLYPDALYCTAGVHPHDAKSWTDEDLSILEDLASNNSECVAVGECGLDFNRNFSPPEDQLRVFELQVELACKLKKPLFVHEREAHEDMVRILSKHSPLPPIVIHCFTGTITEAKKYIELGFYIGLTGFLWKDKSEDGVRKILEDHVIPLDRLLVETDSPYMYPNARAKKLPDDVRKCLTPKSHSFLERYCTFQRNEPCSLPIIVEMIAAFMKVKPEDVALQTTYNALKVFGLDS